MQLEQTNPRSMELRQNTWRLQHRHQQREPLQEPHHHQLREEGVSRHDSLLHAAHRDPPNRYLPRIILTRSVAHNAFHLRRQATAGSRLTGNSHCAILIIIILKIYKKALVYTKFEMVKVLFVL